MLPDKTNALYLATCQEFIMCIKFHRDFLFFFTDLLKCLLSSIPTNFITHTNTIKPFLLYNTYIYEVQIAEVFKCFSLWIPLLAVSKMYL